MMKYTPLRQSYSFHPYEVAFGGYSHSGKTTVICKLIAALSGEYKVGYVKHDVHAFQMDQEQKDTFKAYANGAKSVFISDSKHYAQIHTGTLNMITQKDQFLDADMAFIEGYKHSDIPKLLFIDKEEKILDEFRLGKFSHVIGFIGENPLPSDIPEKYAYFHWNNLSGIKDSVLAYMHKQTQQIPLYGLVLAGGQSTRMKKDKSLLDYHGKTQVEHCYELLSSCCEKVFVSNRQEQREMIGHQALPQIHDTFLNIGPMGGILSAMNAFPQAAWLVLACDLPFVTLAVLQKLIDQRHPFKYATSYQSAYNEFPEPLCSVYEPKILPRLLKFLGHGYRCPRKVLINSNIKMIPQLQKDSLDNINHPEEYQTAIEEIQKNE